MISMRVFFLSLLFSLSAGAMFFWIIFRMESDFFLFPHVMADGLTSQAPTLGPEVGQKARDGGIPWFLPPDLKGNNPPGARAPFLIMSVE